MTLLFTLATGEFVAAIAYVTENPKALAVLLCTSVIGYTGIVSFLFLVQSFGAKNTVIVTSTRYAQADLHWLQARLIAGSSVTHLGVCTPSIPLAEMNMKTDALTGKFSPSWSPSCNTASLSAPCTDWACYP